MSAARISTTDMLCSGSLMTRRTAANVADAADTFCTRPDARAALLPVALRAASAHGSPPHARASRCRPDATSVLQAWKARGREGYSSAGAASRELSCPGWPDRQASQISDQASRARVPALERGISSWYNVWEVLRAMLAMLCAVPGVGRARRVGLAGRNFDHVNRRVAGRARRHPVHARRRPRVSPAPRCEAARGAASLPAARHRRPDVRVTPEAVLQDINARGLPARPSFCWRGTLVGFWRVA